MKRYDPVYEGGRCPLGYEYVEGYFRPHFGVISSYCRRVKRRRNDPEQAENRLN